MSEKSARILVPVGDSPTYRNTVAYAVREALEAAESAPGRGTVHFVYPAKWRELGDENESRKLDVEDLLDRTRVWVTEDLDVDDEDPDPEDLPIDIETAIVGQGRYLFSPGDYASALSAYAHANDLERVIVDPEYAPGGNAPMLQSMELELRRDGLAVEEAPVERPVQRGPLPTRATLSKVFFTFGATFGFYLLIGGTIDTFNLLTGVVVGGLATAMFARIAFVSSPSPRQIIARSVRGAVYSVYLFWEIAKANLSVAYLVLHPDLPIEPKMERFRAAVWGDLEVTTLANSITLTPGTLTVDVRDSLYIHSLTEDARVDLADGGLERAVRFVFYGKDAADIPSPRERESIDADIVMPEEDT